MRRAKTHDWLMLYAYNFKASTWAWGGVRRPYSTLRERASQGHMKIVERLNARGHNLTEENIDTAVASWVDRTTNPGEDFIAAYKIDSGHFKVVSRIEGKIQERVCEVESA